MDKYERITLLQNCLEFFKEHYKWFVNLSVHLCCMTCIGHQEMENKEVACSCITDEEVLPLHLQLACK